MSGNRSPRTNGQADGNQKDQDQDWTGYLTAAQAAERAGMSERVLRRWCEQGRVPFARRRVHNQWMLPRRALQFVKQFPRTTGVAGQTCAGHMRTMAAMLDPACVPLQEAWAAQHPPGSYPGRRDGAPPTHVRYSDAPGELKELWSRTDEGRPLAGRVLQVCRRLGRGGRPFMLLNTDVARVAKVSRDTARKAMESLEALGLLARSGVLRLVGPARARPRRKPSSKPRAKPRARPKHKGRSRGVRPAVRGG
jgi:hypothetical protein